MTRAHLIFIGLLTSVPALALTAERRARDQIICDVVTDDDAYVAIRKVIDVTVDMRNTGGYLLGADDPFVLSVRSLQSEEKRLHRQIPTHNVDIVHFQRRVTADALERVLHLAGAEDLYQIPEIALLIHKLKAASEDQDQVLNAYEAGLDQQTDLPL